MTDDPGPQDTRGRPAVPEQRSGERVVSPGAAARSPLPLNGHRVNPLKVHPSAAVPRQSEEVGVRGGEWEEKKGEGERKDKQEPVSGKSEAGAQRGSEAEDLRLRIFSFYTQ